MKRKLVNFILKPVAFCLSVALIVLTLPLGEELSLATGVPTENTDYMVGEVVLDTNFEEFDEGELPDGWFAGKTAKGWSPGNGSEIYYGSIVDVAEGDAVDKVLYFGAANSDAWLMTEKLPVGNYIYETEITVTGSSGSIAISTQAYGNDYDSFTGANSFATYGSTALVTEAEQTTFKLTGKGSTAFKTEVTNIAFPEGLGKIGVGSTIKFKVISFEGYNHYYVNDVFVYSVANASQTASYGYERVGFYTYGGQWNVNSMKVTSIYTPLEYEPATGLKEGIDFVRGEELVSDWATNYTAIGPRGWWPGTPSVTANNDGSLSFSCNRDAILGYGKISAADYIMEATVTHTGNAGIAFVNNISGAKPLESYDSTTGDTNIGSAMLSLVYPTNWTSITDDKSIAYKDKVNNNEYYPDSLPAEYERPSVGDTYTLKLVCLGGKNYLYYNDVLVLTCNITQYRGANTYVGFYVCNSSLILHDFSVKAIEATPSFDNNVISDGVIIDEDFSSYEDGAFPEGWDKATDKYSNFLWKTANSDYTAEVQSSGSDKFLQISGSSGAHILTLPDLGTENYVLSANVGFQTFGYAFGLATNIKTDNANAKLATINALYGCDIDKVVGGTEDWSYDLPVISSYVRGGSGQNDPKYTDPQMDYYLPNVVKNTTTTTGGVEVSKSDYRIGKVTNGTIFNLKVYHIGGVSYFFVNDVYVNQVADQCKDEATKAGFYICTASQVMRIYDVKAEALTDMNRFADTLSIANPVLDEDFTSYEDGILPEGWELVSTKWTWNGNKGTAAVTTVNGVKGMKITAPGGTAALMLPDYGLSNYVITATGTLLNNQGATGLLANVSSPAASSTAAAHMLTYVGSNYNDDVIPGGDIYHYNRETKDGNDIHARLSDKGLSHFVQGDTFTMSVYVIGGETYFFIDGIFISKNVDSFGLETSLAGLYSCNAEMLFTNITLASVSKKGETKALGVTNIAFGYADILGNSENAGAAGLSFDLALDKTGEFYTEKVEGAYAPTDSFAAGVMVYFGNTAALEQITNTTTGAIELIFDDFTQNDEKAFFSFDLIALGSRVDKYVTVRPFVKIGNEYYFATPVIASAANEANKLYGNMQTSDEIKAKLDKVFGASDLFLGENAKSVTFTVFSDLHYNEGQYMSTVADLNAILARANESNSAFVLSAGDFCNNFKASPELTNAWLNNAYGLDVYNVYGNHELESGNAMSYVTPLLTNDDSVVWGTADGKIGDGSIAYYHTDTEEGFRLVCIDTNYYWDPTSKSWKHNPTNSYGPPDGISTFNCLGPTQLEWLEDVLVDAANKGIPCIVMSHDSFAGKFGSTSPDAGAVREIYAKANAIRKGTVLMSINGHIHTNHQAIVDGVFYLDMNTVRNCVWLGGQTTHHYTDEHTFKKEIYDANGNLLRTEDARLSGLTMGMATWFAADPLSAVVTLDQYGNVKIEGIESDWLYGVAPSRTNDGEEPRVLSGQWQIDY